MTACAAPATPLGVAAPAVPGSSGAAANAPAVAPAAWISRRRLIPPSPAVTWWLTMSLIS